MVEPERWCREPFPHGLGVMLPQGPVPVGRWHEAPAAFAALERADCSAIWLTDHLFWGVDVPEALSFAAAAVSSTSRCAVGTGVLQLPLRRTAAVAKAAATIQQLSRGRFHLGVGSGEHEQEYRRAGVPFDERGRALDRALRDLRELWVEPASRYAQQPSPEYIPIWVGGRSTAALERTAEHGDGWLPIFLTVDRFREDNERLDGLLVENGRKGSSVCRGVVVLAATTSATWARQDASEWVGELWGMNPSMLDRYLITGSADEVVAHICQYVQSGADHVVVLPATPEPVPAFEELNAGFMNAVNHPMRTAP